MFLKVIFLTAPHIKFHPPPLYNNGERYIADGYLKNRTNEINPNCIVIYYKRQRDNIR